jgi:hypothetical protein
VTVHLTDAGPDARQDLVVVGVAPRLLLRVNEVVVDHDLERAAPRRNQREIADVVFELL